MDNIWGAAVLDIQTSAVLKCWLQRDFHVISLLAASLSISITGVAVWEGGCGGSRGPSQWCPILSISSMLSH